uniref:Uncharacterized protein n=1 Tax=Schistocephalus solidus TaxID=70667 RepID=A0A0X3NH32_SCHSO
MLTSTQSTLLFYSLFLIFLTIVWLIFPQANDYFHSPYLSSGVVCVYSRVFVFRFFEENVKCVANLITLILTSLVGGKLSSDTCSFLVGITAVYLNVKMPHFKPNVFV